MNISEIKQKLEQLKSKKAKQLQKTELLQKALLEKLINK